MSAGTASYQPGNLSPISSDGGYSGHSASEQTGRVAQAQKVVDDGPLVPPNAGVLAGYGQARQMYSSPNEFGSQGVLTPLAPIAEVRYSLETDRGHYRVSSQTTHKHDQGHLANKKIRVRQPPHPAPAALNSALPRPSARSQGPAP